MSLLFFFFFFFFFNDTATTEIYTTYDTLSLHDALPIPSVVELQSEAGAAGTLHGALQAGSLATTRSEEHTSELQSPQVISYAVFCLKKKKRREGRSHMIPKSYQLSKRQSKNNSCQRLLTVTRAISGCSGISNHFFFF